MYTLMLIEDDMELCTLTKEYLERYGYQVHTVKDFSAIEEEFVSILPDLVLLDINLPYSDGYYLCKAIRRVSNAPIIVVSARSGNMDQVMAIELGADDYIIKPFQLEILLVKVNAAIRRVYGQFAARDQKESSRTGLYLDEGLFQMFYGEKMIDLSKNEYRLAKVFIENKDRVITRDELFEAIWDDSNFVDDNTLTVNISRLKRKLMELGIHNLIKNKRRVGYIVDYKVLEGNDRE